MYQCTSTSKNSVSALYIDHSSTDQTHLTFAQHSLFLLKENSKRHEGKAEE